MKYQLQETFDLMGNKKLAIRLNVYSLILFLVLYISGLVLLAILGEPLLFNFENLIYSFVTFISIILLTILHELIHGLFFKIYSPHSKVKYGFKNGYAYATSPGIFYKKKQFYVIVLMPFIMITTGMIISAMLGVSPATLLFLFSIHTSACIGDFYFCYMLMKKEKNIFVEDTEIGFNIHVQIPD